MHRRQQRRNSTMTGSVSGPSKPQSLSGPSSAGTSASSSSCKAAKSTQTESVQVVVRVRPLMFHEQGSSQCVSVKKDVYADHPSIIHIGDSNTKNAKPQQFTFDEAFPVSTTQKQVFTRRVAPLVDRCLEGFHSTIIAYGQTGAGKTHTIMGPAMEMDDESAGVIPRAVTKVFDDLNAMKAQDPTLEYEVRVQFLEIYGEELRDLLAVGKKVEKLTIRDAGVEEPEVLGAAQHKVESAEEALSTLSRGMMKRVTASTAMNASSSRSHAMMSLLIHQTKNGSSINSEDGDAAPAEPESKKSKLSFLDLAGAERQKRTKATGKRLKEGVDINKGLLVLGNVISALGDPKKRQSFVPYRDSKLTRLLKGSLGGNHKSLMIACVSPADKNMAESINCLRYANRAKNIQNKAVQNVDPKSKMLQDFKETIGRLAHDLLQVKSSVTPEPEQNWSFSAEELQVMAKGAPEAKSTKGETSPKASTEQPHTDAEETTTESQSDSTAGNYDNTNGLKAEVLELREKLAAREEEEGILMNQTLNYLDEINRLQQLLAERPRAPPPPVPQPRRCSTLSPSISIDISIAEEGEEEEEDEEEKLDDREEKKEDSDSDNNEQGTNAPGRRRKTGDVLKAKNEIMSATTDVCGCVFLTVANEEGKIQLVKDTSDCLKGHGGGPVTTAPPKETSEGERPSWLQRWRS